MGTGCVRPVQRAAYSGAIAYRSKEPQRGRALLWPLRHARRANVVLSWCEMNLSSQSVSTPSAHYRAPDSFAQSAAGSPWRILVLLNLFRALVPLVLASIYFAVHPTPIGVSYPALFGSALVAYGLFSIGCFFSIKRRWPEAGLQILMQVLVDSIAIALLTYASGGASSGLATLLILPVTAAGLILRPRLAMLLAACGTIALLVQQVITLFATNADAGGITSMGLTGALLFCLTLGASYAATQLRDSEAAVQQREVDIANLAELNEFIVQHLRESILVVDQNDCVRLINESAAQLLKDGPVAANTLLGELSPRLLYLLDTWRRQGAEDHSATLSLVSADGSTVIQPHFVALNSKDPGPTLIFLEDTSIIAERVQQSKLAALGRLSASIAHEVRNPVGAMSHAAQLLRESPQLGSADQRLTQIITDNGERVSQIINNILQLSRRENTHAERLSLNKWVDEFADQFRRSFQLSAGAFVVDAPDFAVEVRADASHLQQIVTNLCENALKYGRSHQQEQVVLRFGRIGNNNRPYLEIADRGAGIAPELAERIFEPFFTGGDGGTGLGLFIAREMAHCNRAVLLYEPRHGGGSIFRIVFSDPQRWEI
jgi:two-component system, NtrC family, sensor histidine kinase PilS